MGKPKSSRRRNRQARGYILGSRSFSSSANQSQSSGESSRFIQAQSAILSQAPEQAISQSPTPSIASSSYKTAETQVSASSYHTAIRQVASNNENDEILPSKPATPTPATIPRAASQLGESSSAIHRQLPQVASELDESTSSLTPAPKSKLTSQVDSGPHSTMPISKIVSQIDEGDSSTTPNPRPKAASQIGENAPSPITPGLVSQLAREISGSNSFPRRPCPTNPVLYNPLTPSRKSGNVPRPTRRRGNDLNLEKADITPKSKANYPSMLEHSKSPADKKIDSIKKSLNVDSPSFTPATLSVPGKGTGGTISSQAVNAAPFTPRGMASGEQHTLHAFCSN